MIVPGWFQRLTRHQPIDRDGVAEFFDMAAACFQGFALTSSFPYTASIAKHSILSEGAAIMAMLTISLSDEEMRRLEVLGKREGLTVEQMVRLGINDFIGQLDDAFCAAAKRVMEKNAELYRRLS